MAKPNYSFEKRQKELAKKKKKEEKRLKKAEASNMQSQDAETPGDSGDHTHTGDDKQQADVARLTAPLRSGEFECGET